MNHPNLTEKLAQAEQQYQAGVQQLNQLQTQLLMIQGSIETLKGLVAEQEATSAEEKEDN